MSNPDSTTPLEDAHVVVPCRICGMPTNADAGRLVCFECRPKRQWTKRDPSIPRNVLYAAYSRNRQARKQGNGGTHTAADIRKQYERQDGLCFYCKTKVGDKYHVDHFMPLVLGGSNGPEKLVIACSTCNLTKNAKHPLEFCVGLDIDRAL